MILIEKKVETPIPECWGTCDAIIVKGNVLHIVDFKYGKGHRVMAQDNTQMLIYAIGAYHELDYLYDFAKVKMVIVQPRLDHIDESTVSVAELMQWQEQLIASANAALKMDAPRNPSEKACHFCKAKAHCGELAHHSLLLALDGFEAIEPDMQTTDISNIDLSVLLPQLNLFSNWIKGIEARAIEELGAGHEIPNYKLVEGRSLRQWIDEEKTESALRHKLKVSEIFIKKMVSPAQAEKLLGKGNPLLKELVTKPPGKPTIAPVTDKRPAIDVTAGFSEIA